MIKIETLKSLEKNMNQLSELKEELYNKQQVFNEQNEDLIKKIELLNNDKFHLKEVIKVAAADEFKDTGNKKLCGGVGIRVCSNLEYDRGIAFDWAKQHDLCLSISLDVKAFESVAKTQPIDFVTKKEHILVTFPKKIKFEKIENEG